MPQRPKDPYAVEPRRLPSGRWKGRVVRYDPETGKRHELTQTFDTKKEAKQWAEAEALQYRADPNRKPPSNQTLAEFFPQWIQVIAAQGLADTTLMDYQYMGAHALAAFGHRPLKNLNTWDIQQLYTAMAETHSSRTINYVHTVLNRLLKDAVDWGLIASNPAAKAKPPRGQRRPVVILTPAEAQHFLASTQGRRWHILWALMLHAGLRPGEAIAVRWQDIHWDTQTLHVMQAVTVEKRNNRRRHVLGPTKTDRSTRPVALGPRMLDLLRTRKAEQAVERAAVGNRWDDHDLVFTTRTGTLLGPRNVARAFHTDRQRAGLPDTIHPHCLRHTMASHWLADGQSIKVVSERLGHTSVAFTLQTYAHLLPNQQADAATAMDAALFADPSERAADGPQNNPKPSQLGQTLHDTETAQTVIG